MQNKGTILGWRPLFSSCLLHFCEFIFTTKNQLRSKAQFVNWILVTKTFKLLIHKNAAKMSKSHVKNEQFSIQAVFCWHSKVISDWNGCFIFANRPSVLPNNIWSASSMEKHCKLKWKINYFQSFQILIISVSQSNCFKFQRNKRKSSIQEIVFEKKLLSNQHYLQFR